MHLKALALVVSVVCLAPEVGAQTSPSGSMPVAPGTRVRVKTATTVAPLIANFLEQRSDTLVFIEDGTGRGVWSFQLSQIERLERTAGEFGHNRGPMVSGATIGAGAGLVAGLIFAQFVTPSDSTREYNAVLTGLAGAGVGAGVGAYLGSRVKRERWISVPLPRQQFSLRSDGRRFTISYTFR